MTSNHERDEQKGPRISLIARMKKLSFSSVTSVILTVFFFAGRKDFFGAEI